MIRLLLPVMALFCLFSATVRGQVWEAQRVPVPDLPAEFRGVWIATVHNLDWPSKRGLPAAAQKAELTRLLDLAASMNLNAVVLQVRPAADALYASPLEPWSPVLTGRMGVSPGYDPLQFAVDEAHRRGLELHAWVNPFRALAGSQPASAQHISRRRPDWMRPFAGQTWMDPGEPGVQAHTLEVVRDILRRYDVDGIHIDDYFYPYPVEDSAGRRRNIPFPDDATWRKYGRGGDRDDWRRDNINRFVRSFYAEAKRVRPAAKVGISPFGIWRPGVPSGIEARLDAVRDIHADSRLWLRSGWCDYFSPQLYWPIQPPAQSFPALLQWWRGQSRARPVWPGIAASRIGGPTGHTAAEIVRETGLARQGAMPGAMFWSIGAFRRNAGGVTSRLQRELFAGRAVVPAMPWLGGRPPGAPERLRATRTADGLAVEWSPGSGSARWWVVQARAQGTWSTREIRFHDRRSVVLSGNPDAVAVRGLSASGLAGPPAVVVRR